MQALVTLLHDGSMVIRSRAGLLQLQPLLHALFPAGESGAGFVFEGVLDFAHFDQAAGYLRLACTQMILKSRSTPLPPISAIPTYYVRPV